MPKPYVVDDAQFFIHAVKKNRPLYDRKWTGNGGRRTEAKDRAWDNVAALVYSGWSEKSAACKSEKVGNMKKKWKSLKIAFSEELRSRAAHNNVWNDTGLKKYKKPFVHYDQMKPKNAEKTTTPNDAENDAKKNIKSCFKNNQRRKLCGEMNFGTATLEMKNNKNADENTVKPILVVLPILRTIPSNN